jgi:hypothetical protein
MEIEENEDKCKGDKYCSTQSVKIVQINLKFSIPSFQIVSLYSPLKTLTPKDRLHEQTFVPEQEMTEWKASEKFPRTQKMQTRVFSARHPNECWVPETPETPGTQESLDLNFFSAKTDSSRRLKTF